MKLRKKRLINKFYLKYYQVEHQNIKNGCDYFWTLLIALISLPITIFTLPFASINSMIGSCDTKLTAALLRTLFGILIELISFIIIVLAINYPLGLFLYILGVVAFILAIKGVVTFLLWYDKKENKDWETIVIAKEAIKSFKEKHCPKIEWVD